ncbi:MAG: phytanoyl-CoA dioxygenase family protein [Rhodobacteraceae bacterium]|nr:MAG: phytanoyl-CoA dioxygenase family protein [Paracoccaceae bacterium]
MVAAYARDGFLVLDGFASPETCALLRGRVADLIEAFDPDQNRVAFSAAAQAHAAEDYFRESGDKVRFFVEEGAVAADGALDRPKTKAVNKIGHALHDLDPIFGPFSRDPRLAETAADLGLADPALAQSMVICKQPEIGGEVTLHQDATFLHTEPVSVTGFWVALEAADRENGCLFAVPGGHAEGLKRRFRYDGDDLVMEVLDAAPFAGAEVALEAPEGALVVLHGLVPHRSGPNLSARSRLAYALHVVDRAAAWSPDNWLKRAPEMPFRGFDE